MSKERWQIVVPYLDRALEMGPSERAGWVAGLRAGDPGLAADLEALLDRHDALSREGFLTASPDLPSLWAAAGERVGAYALVSPIGQGGAGTVWRARRSDGRFEGVAAVKLLNPMLLGQVGHARFEREAGILARLSHPHIAHLMDAGWTSSGQPYLVLELVDGEPIDSFCDHQRMTVEARVRLFLDVLAAVDHAHRHLIVHRDIKPSNVLVTSDGRVVLLDFGIAKLLDAEEGGVASALTREGGLAMTPAYAAPEQVTGNPISTATDVYALGVLLYQLLSGRHPAALALGSPAELYKTIVEVEPPRLSSGDGDQALSDAAARRATTADRLRRLLRGDLETIAARALRKAPDERYASVAALADDLRRTLEHQPIRARPETFAYRVTKLVRRNRVPTALAALVSLAVAIGVAAASAQARRASAEAARANSMRAFMFDVFAEAEPGAAGGPTTVVDAIERAVAAATADQLAEPRARLELVVNLAGVLGAQGELERARGLLASAIDQIHSELGAGDRLGLEAEVLLLSNEIRRGDLATARAHADRLLPRIPDDAIDLRVAALRRSANLACIQRDRARAIAEARLAVELARGSGQEALVASALSDLANAQVTLEAIPDAIRTYQEVLPMVERRYGTEHANVAAVHAAFARAYRRGGDLAHAEAHARSAVAIDRKVYREDHWRLALHLSGLAVVLDQRRAYADALPLERESLRIRRATLGVDHPETLTSLHNVAMMNVHLERFDRAVPLLREALAGSIARYGAGHAETALSHACLGQALAGAGQRAEAEAEIDRALAIAEALEDPDPGLVADSVERRVRVALDAGDPAAALPFLDRMREAAARLNGTDPYWVGRVDALRGDVLLRLGRHRAAIEALDAAASQLGQSESPEAVLGAEVPLLRAAALAVAGDRDRARELAREGRARLDALPSPPGRLAKLAAVVSP